MEKQSVLADFDGYHLAEKGLPATVLALLEQGYGVRQIGRKVGKSHVLVLKTLKKLEEKGFVEHFPRVWIVKYPKTGVVTKTSLGKLGGNRRNWEPHHIKFYARIKRVGSQDALARACTPFYRKAGGAACGWVFRRPDVTLVVRRKSVQASVFGVWGDEEGTVARKAGEKLLPVARLFEGDTGFRFSDFELHRPIHWVLSKTLSTPLLRVMPELADSSHPEQVELHDSEQVAAVKSLVNGSLKADLVSLIQEQRERIEGLEFLVREQAVVLQKVVELLKLGGI